MFNATVPFLYKYSFCRFAFGATACFDFARAQLAKSKLSQLGYVTIVGRSSVDGEEIATVQRDPKVS